MAAASLNSTEAVLADLDAQPATDTAAHIVITLEKCPTCDAHVVRVNLVNYTAAKELANSSIGTLEQFEPVSSEPGS
jgi:hypothetical protein